MKSVLNKVVGARSRQSLVFAAVVVALVVVALRGVVGYVAMPALAGLLMLIGHRTIKPVNLRSTSGIPRTDLRRSEGPHGGLGNGY